MKRRSGGEEGASAMFRVAGKVPRRGHDGKVALGHVVGKNVPQENIWWHGRGMDL